MAPFSNKPKNQLLYASVVNIGAFLSRNFIIIIECIVDWFRFALFLSLVQWRIALLIQTICSIIIRVFKLSLAFFGNSYIM